MLLLIAAVFNVANIALRPLGDGLSDTSLWVAKIIGPPATGDVKADALAMKMGQSALMAGWLSNVPFLCSALLIASIVIGFFYAWWAGLLMFVASVFFVPLAKIFFGRSCSYYLLLLHQKMASRIADYRRQNDHTRREAAEWMLDDIEEVMTLYNASHVRPPNAKQLREIDFGDLHGWLLAQN